MCKTHESDDEQFRNEKSAVHETEVGESGFGAMAESQEGFPEFIPGSRSDLRDALKPHDEQRVGLDTWKYPNLHPAKNSVGGSSCKALSVRRSLHRSG
jgi:hypothetical protein